MTGGPTGKSQEVGVTWGILRSGTWCKNTVTTLYPVNTFLSRKQWIYRLCLTYLISGNQTQIKSTIETFSVLYIMSVLLSPYSLSSFYGHVVRSSRACLLTKWVWGESFGVGISSRARSYTFVPVLVLEYEFLEIFVHDWMWSVSEMFPVSVYNRVH